MDRCRGRFVASSFGTMLLACAPPPAASPPQPDPTASPPAEASGGDATAEHAAADEPASLPPPPPGEVPQIHFGRLRERSLGDGVYRITGYFLGPTRCPKGPPNAGLCASRWIIAPRGRTPDGAVRAGELAVFATHDITGTALVREPGELPVADLVGGRKYTLVVAVREVSGERYFTLPGARIIP